LKVLVTGIAGFMGSHIADELLRSGNDVVGVDDLSGGFRRNIPAGAGFHQISILDHEAVDRLFQKEKFAAVFHLAAYAAEGLSHFIRRYNYQTNLIGSVNLLNSAVVHGTGCFVFCSSIAVYGAAQVPMTEDIQPRPEDPYGISKLAFEQDLAAAHEMFGIDYVIFRPHNVYGERQNLADRYRNVVGIFMNQALTGKPFSIFGDGEQTRAFSHIADVAPVIARSMQVESARNEIFNIGADVPYTVNQLAAAVSAAMEVPLRVEYLPARQEVLHAYSDHAKVWNRFGSRPQIGLEEGVARMASWARQVGASEPVTFDGIEVAKNMPPSWQSLLRRDSV
jgi:UDP-glucose 4-epimerase